MLEDIVLKAEVTEEEDKNNYSNKIFFFHSL